MKKKIRLHYKTQLEGICLCKSSQILDVRQQAYQNCSRCSIAYRAGRRHRLGCGKKKQSKETSPLTQAVMR